ncbi:MAG: type 3 dihydrofolate reductase [Gammaproteobacteria bacterium]|nr:type 3 dihydrofolate reductase [Gammaproteobacteria bacterium]
MTASLSIISAMDENRLIGNKNTLPWHLPADLAFFKRTTLNKPILMGRKTYESIGRPLPGRRNIIITRNTGYEQSGCEIVASIDEALVMVNDQPEVMLIGGASLYEQTINQATRLYITQIHAQFEGDAWFPEIDPIRWQEVWREAHQADAKNPCDYSFVKYLLRK